MKFSKTEIINIEDKNLFTDQLGNDVDLKINDQMKRYKKPNVLTLFDEDGNIIATTTNKIVASGRVESIETMFRNYAISDKYPEISYDKPDNQANPRWISVFGVGSGGAPLTEGLNPFVVNPNATELSTPLQFRTTTPNQQTVKYYDNFKKKDFTALYLNWDKQADDVYALLVCELDYGDLLGKVVNEIGLYNCTHIFDSQGNITDKQKFTLYAKANMVSINKSPLQNTSAYKIAYKVFI